MSDTDNFVYCERCGEKFDASKKICPKCGFNVSSSANNEKPYFQDIVRNKQPTENFTNSTYDENNKGSFTNSDMAKFVQKNTDYYMLKFEKIQKENNNISWNWAAFLFGCCWFLYRKMYLLGGIIIIVNAILSSLLPRISLVISLLISILCGLYGNMLYLKFVNGKLDEFSNMEQSLKEATILKKGGVNIVIPIIAAAILVIYLIALSVLGIFLVSLASLA